LKLTAITQRKGNDPLTKVVAFVPISLRCSRKRTNVTVRPRTQSVDESLVKPEAGREEICVLRIFALQTTGL